MITRRTFLTSVAATVGGILPGHMLAAQSESCTPIAANDDNVVVAFTSVGDGVSPQFELQAGTYVVRAKNTVLDSFYSVRLLPIPGTGEPFEADIISFGEGFGPGTERSWADTAATAGTYVLTVEGVGDWSVTVEQ